MAAATLTVTDDDTRGVAVSPTELPVPEGGDATYTVVLESEPTGPVTVAPTRATGSSSDVTVSPTNLSFTAANWDTAQTVTVSAAADDDADHDTEDRLEAIGVSTAAMYRRGGSLSASSMIGAAESVRRFRTIREGRHARVRAWRLRGAGRVVLRRSTDRKRAP